jgi:hypothetical protein
MSARQVRLPILRELGEAEAVATCLDNTRITFSHAVDLLLLVKESFYDPRMRGSFSIKKVLPVIADDMRYDELDEVQEAGSSV